MSDATRLLVLQALRLSSVATEQDIARRYSLEVRSVAAVLSSASERGWVRRTEGVLTGWTLTTTGRSVGERLLGEELSRSGAGEQLGAAYGEFVPMNRQLLAICTDWQVVTVGSQEVVNDHSDPERDAGVLARLQELHSAARPLVDRLAEVLDRFGGYGSRLGAAHERIMSGETEWLTKPTIDSYHTVWFELHEDLLATLGRRRSDERHDAAGDRNGSRG